MSDDLRARARWPRVPRPVVLVTVVVVVVAGVLLVLRPDDEAATSDDPAAATLSGCTPTEPVTSVGDLNAFIEKVRGDDEFQGADVGADVLLRDGRRLWVFGDTLRSASFDGQRFVRNSMLVLDDRCLRAVVPADRGALVPDRADGVGYWPMSIGAVRRDGHELVGVGLQRVRGADAPDGAAAFENLGPAFALFRVEPGEVPELVDVRDLGEDSSDPARPTWGRPSRWRTGGSTPTGRPARATRARSSPSGSRCGWHACARST